MRKQLRQYLSLIVATVMVLSLSPGTVKASSAQENNNMLWFEENFNGDTFKATLTSGSKQYADISESSALVTDSGDDKSFRIIAQRNSLTSGGYGGLFTNMLPAGKVSDIYSISYNIKFEDYSDATDILARIITRDENGGAILDGAFYSKNSDGKVAILDGILNEGWNTVEHIYDTINDEETIFLNGEYVGIIAQNSSGFKQFAIAPTNTVNIYVDDILVRDIDAFCTEGMKNSYTADGNISFKLMLPHDCTNADIMVDTELFDSIETVNGQYIYDVQIESGQLEQGEHEIEIVAYCEDGDRSISKNINIIAQTPDLTSWKQDMSDYADELTTTDDVKTALEMNAITLQGGASLVKSTGLGNRTDDVSLSFVNNSEAYTDKYSYFDKNITANSGRVSISFDIYNGSGKDSLNQYLLIQGVGNSNGYEMFTFAVTQNQWTNVRLELDFDNGSYVKTDNNGTVGGDLTLTSVTNLRFRGSPYANGGKLVSFDNLEIFAYVPIETSLSGYSVGDISVDSVDVVSNKADKISFDVNKTFSFVEGILLDSHGDEVSGTSFEAISGRVTMSVESFLSEGEYAVVLMPATQIENTPIGVRVQIPFEVTENSLIVPENALNISNGDVIYESPQFFTANVIADKTIFYLDGEKLGEAENKIAVPELSYGNHTLTVVCIAADGSAQRIESNFTFAKKILIKREFQSFNEIYGGADTPIDNNTLSTVKFELVQPDNANLYSVGGKSGESSDGAVKFEIKTNDLLTSSWPGLESKGFVGYNTGVSTIEFDVKLNSDKADEILITNPYLWWSDRYNLAYGGAWRGNTAVTVPANTQWAHICLEIDADNKKVSFAVDDVILADKVAYTQDAANVYQNMSVRISSKQNVVRSEGEAHAGFTIDNFKAENIKVYTPASAEVISEGLKITIPDGVSQKFSKDNISLRTADGQIITVDSAVRSDDGREIIVKAQLPKGRIIEAVLSKELKYLDGETFDKDNVMLLETDAEFIETEASFQVDGNELFCAGQISGGETISASVNYNNVSGAEQSIVYVLTARKNGRLIAITSKSLTVGSSTSGSVSPQITLPANAEGCEIYLMICDSLKNSKAVGKYIKIN